MSTATAMPGIGAARAGLAAVGLMWVLPFLQPWHRLPLPSFYSEWLALVLGLVALVMLAHRGLPRPAMPWPAWPLVLLIGVLVLQYALGRVAYGGQALTAGLYFAWVVLLIMLGRALRDALGLESVSTVLAWFLAAGGTASAVLALLQHFELWDLAPALITPKRHSAVAGNLSQPNHLAHYSALALASLAYLNAARRLHPAAVALAASGLLYVMTLSGSRSGALFIALLFALALAYRWRRAPGAGRLLGCTALFAAGFVLAQWLASWSSTAAEATHVTVLDRVAGGAAEGAAMNVEYRLQAAKVAWQMFLQAPLLGAGWGQFPWHDFQYRALAGLTLESWPFHNAHNIVLHLLAETGLAGALLVGAAAAAWLAGFLRAPASPERWWLLALAGVLAAHSLLEYPLWYAYFLGIAAVAAGLSPGGHVSLRPAAARLLVLLTVAGGLFVGGYALVDYRRFERVVADRSTPPAVFVRTVSGVHRNPLLRPYAELVIATRLEVDRQRLAEKRRHLERVLRFAPIASVAFRYPMLLALEGRADEARRHFTRAARVYPRERANAARMLREAASRHPGELAPLLELAPLVLESVAPAGR